MPLPLKTCFVVMPISDLDGYQGGHFGRVYDHLIKPACAAVGLTPTRADDVKATNFIVVDILQRILDSDLVICDLSGRNPNVLYELGLRQAFDLPVVLIKDGQTDRIFDIQGLRTLDYDVSLRVDTVARDLRALVAALESTLKIEAHEINSLIRLLGIQKATIGDRAQISPETALIMGSLKDLSERLSFVEELARNPPSRFARRGTEAAERIRLPNGEAVAVGAAIYDATHGKHVELGKLVSLDSQGAVVRAESGQILSIPPDDEIFSRLTSIPF